MGPAATVFLTCMISYLLFLNLTHKTETGTAEDGNTTNSKPSSQSTAAIGLCCAFRQPQHPVQKCWAKTILLSQINMF
jgi:hypothetical protein